MVKGNIHRPIIHLLLAGDLRKYFRMSALLMLFSVFDSHSATLEGKITDETGLGLANAVVVATPIQGLLQSSPTQALTAVLDQRNREFIPHVLVVRSGTSVSFPNNDNIRHHIYSFSPIKRFEVKLYKDMPPNPIKFDMPGIAVLGCNIHDWMISYMFVTDSPYFTKTDQNGDWLLDVPGSTYKVSIWHPYMVQSEMFVSDSMNARQDQVIYLNQSIAIKHKVRNGKPPASLQAEVYNGDP